MMYFRSPYITAPFYRRASPFAPMLTPFSPMLTSFFDDDDFMEPEPAVYFYSRPTMRVSETHSPKEHVASFSQGTERKLEGNREGKDMEVDEKVDGKADEKAAPAEKNAMGADKRRGEPLTTMNRENTVATTDSSAGKHLDSLLNDWESVAWKDVPDIEVEEDDKAHHYKLSGLKDENIEINLEHGRHLVISGKSEKKNETEHYTSTFTRSLALPSDANKEDIRAEFNEGHLAIHVPKKSPVVSTKRISIPINTEN